MSKKKEREQALRLTDEMILIQGIVLIEQGARLMRWNNPEGINEKLNALEGILYELVKECTKTATGETLYLEISSNGT
jgi:hypothetical protein